MRIFEIVPLGLGPWRRRQIWPPGRAKLAVPRLPPTPESSCCPHNEARDALYAQAAKAAPVTKPNGQKVPLREFLEEMEMNNKAAFMEQLEDFAIKFLV